MLGGQLLQADRRRQAGRAAADDDDVVFHRFARAVLGEDFFVGHGLIVVIMISHECAACRGSRLRRILCGESRAIDTAFVLLCRHLS